MHLVALWRKFGVIPVTVPWEDVEVALQQASLTVWLGLGLPKTTPRAG